MPRTSNVPAYRLHKPSGLARVIVDGKHIYLGTHGSQESKAKYARLIAERASGPLAGQRLQVTVPSDEPTTISDVLLAYNTHAEQHYGHNGKRSSESQNMKLALRPLRLLYGNTLAAEFGPKQLKAVRQHMIDSGICRNLVNARIHRVRRVFRWAASEQMIPTTVYDALQTVDGLRRGHAGVRESKPVKPVADDVVAATLPFVARQVAAMIRLQQLTGMRSGEVVIMRAAEIDRAGEVWFYRPTDHKTQNHGHDRIVALGAKAQRILEPFLVQRPEQFLFAPADAEAERSAARRSARKSPMTPSQAKRKPKSRPKRQKRERYDDASYRRAIEYGIKRAAKNEVTIPHWHPHQLRHSYATAVRRAFGIEAAQVGLGHSKADVTQLYAERDLLLAERVAKELG